MEFGKYKGLPIDLVPNQYFTYLLTKEPSMLYLRDSDLYCKTHKELSKVRPELVDNMFLKCDCRKPGFSFGFITKRKKGNKFVPVVAVKCRRCRKEQTRLIGNNTSYKIGATFGKVCNTNKCFEHMTVLITEKPQTIKSRNSKYYRALQRGVRSKNAIKLADLPYDAEDLRQHLQSQFTRRMSFDNYGKWHIDHIKPVSEFLFLEENDFNECWALSNLQPLWENRNIAKGGFKRNQARWDEMYKKYKRDSNAL